MRVPAGAFWIGGAHAFDLAEAYLNFRADLVLAGPPRRARLHLAADSRYRLWVNGRFIGRGPERSWPSSMAVDRHDLAARLRPGANQIAVQVYSPGYSHFAYRHRGACGLIAWVEVDGQTALVSDTGWKVQRDPSWAERVARVSIYGSGVEERDLRQEVDWLAGDAGGWPAARLVQGPAGPIWARLRPRRTPQPVEERRALDAPCQQRLAPTAAPGGPDPHADLRALLAASGPMTPGAKAGPGQTRLWIFDLGASHACLGGAEVVARGGERLLISYAEKLAEGGVLLSDPANYCRMRPTDRFTLRPGPQVAEGFTPRGARYLVFALDGAAEPRFFARLPAYPLAERPLPALPAPLAAVARICRQTTLACLQDGFVDGVWRESSLWLGDAVAQDWALRALSDDARPLLFALDMAAEGADAEGLLPSVLPGEVPAYAVTDYNFAWVELLAGCAGHPGIAAPQAVWRRHWRVLRRLLARIECARGPDGLIRNPPGRRLFLDWSAMGRGEPNLTLNLRYLHALRLAQGIARALGRGAPWAEEARALGQAIRSCHTEQGRWVESPGGPPASQLALALLILTDLAPDPQALAEAIVSRALNAADGPLPGQPALASPFMHHYLFQALGHLGRHDAIARIIALRWGRWAAEGAVTTPENWDISFPDGSACHGFSAHPLGWLAHLARLGAAG